MTASWTAPISRSGSRGVLGVPTVMSGWRALKPLWDQVGRFVQVMGDNNRVSAAIMPLFMGGLAGQ